MKNLKQKLISFAIVITMSMGVATLPAFASSYPDTQSSNALSWYVSWQGTSRSIARGQSIANILASMARWLDSDAEAIYNRMGGLSSDIQDVVTAIGNIPGATDYSTVLNSIDSKIKDYTNNFASVENKLQSIINNLVNVNTGLTNIKTDTNSIVTNTNNTNTKLESLLSKYVAITTSWNYISKSYPGSTVVSAVSRPTPRYLTWSVETRDDNVTIPKLNVGSAQTISNALDYLAYLNSNTLTVATLIRNIGTEYTTQLYTTDASLESTVRKPVAIMDYYNLYYPQFDKMLKRLGFVLADDDTIAAKNANKPQEQSVISNFTGSGDASASVSDFVGVKDSVSALKTSLSGGASYTQAFNILGGDSDGWSWFTTEVAESMDSTGNGSTRRGSVPISTPYLDSYYDSIYSVIGINGGIE